MKKLKKILMICLVLLIFSLVIGQLSAADNETVINNTDSNQTINELNNLVQTDDENGEDDIVYVSNFTELNFLIQSGKNNFVLSGDIFITNKDAENVSSEGIYISNDVTIDGNGHKITFDSTTTKSTRFFKFITGTAILTLINITLDGGNAYKGGIISGSSDIHLICKGDVVFSNSFLDSPESTSVSVVGGGAIYAGTGKSGSLFINVEGLLKFINNVAAVSLNDECNGGAIFALNNVNIEGTGNVQFLNNSGSNGGAIYTKNGNVNINIDTLFSENKAIHKGSYSTSKGAAIYCSGILNLNNKVINFNNNIAGLGGAIYIAGSGSIVGNCSFLNNTANSKGGAIYIAGSGSIVGNCSFLNNTANSVGGAIYFDGVSNKFINCIFKFNKIINGDGGAIYSYPSTITNSNTIIDKCLFENNFSLTTASTGSGGALFLKIKNCTISNCNFTNNQADSKGGAFEFMSSAYVNIINCIFINNTSNYNGASILLKDSSNSNINNCNFVSKSIKSEIYLESTTSSSTVSFNNNTFDIDKSIPCITLGSGTYPYKITSKVTATVLEGQPIFCQKSIIYPVDVVFIDDMNNTIAVLATHRLSLFGSSSTYVLNNNGNYSEYSFSVGTATRFYIFSVTNCNYFTNLNIVRGALLTCNNDSFTALDCFIELNSAGQVLKLKNNFQLYSTEKSTYSTGIKIAKNVIIDGNNFYITGNSLGSIFGITAEGINLTLTNVTLQNGYISGSGGAIYSNYDLNLILNGNVTFKDNTASNIGGALYVGQYKININGDCNLTFLNNIATSGGGIRADSLIINITGLLYADNNQASGSGGGGGFINTRGDVNITSFNCIFNNNKAIYISGVLHANNGNVYINCKNNITVSDNSADSWVGAISGVYTVQTIAKNINFEGNSAGTYAGAIRVSTAGGAGVILNANENIIFYNNNALNGNGIIYSASDVTIKAQNISFIQNSVFVTVSATDSYNGGTIYAVGKVNITSSKLEFINNTATIKYSSTYTYTCYNGGVGILSKGNVYINSTDVNFDNNIATFTKSTYPTFYNRGMAIYAVGDLIIDSSILKLNKNTFTVSGSNKIYNQGGAIYANKVTINALDGIISNHSSGTGGAIYSVTDVDINGGFNFINNTAISTTTGNDFDGGAIYAKNKIKINGTNINFSYNSALNSGGALFAQYIDIFSDNVTFNNNEAKTYDGGAIFGNLIINIDVLNITFNNNKGYRQGGAIFVGQNGNGIYLKANKMSFFNNYVTVESEDGGGGAIVSFNNIELYVVEEALFNNNTAGCFGGALGAWQDITRDCPKII